MCPSPQEALLALGTRTQIWLGVGRVVARPIICSLNIGAQCDKVTAWVSTCSEREQDALIDNMWAIVL